MSAHEAGRELDALIAEKVMGWTLWRSPAAPGSVPDCWRTGNSENPSQLIAYWSPSTDIAAAWQVMEAMIARGLRPSLGLLEDGRWICDGHWDDLHGDQSAPTAPLAICRAALEAVEAQA